MRKPFTVLAFIAAAVGVLAPVLVYTLDLSAGIDARKVRVLPEPALTANRVLFTAGDDPAKTVGEPADMTPQRYIIYNKANIVEPTEGPAKGGKFILVHDGGEAPVQTQMVFFVTRWITTVAFIAAGGLFLLASLFKPAVREHQPTPAKASAA